MAQKHKHQSINWCALSGFRNVLAHDYLGGIDLSQIWDAVESDLPRLEAAALRPIQQKH